jgi:hypothetical protein
MMGSGVRVPASASPVWKSLQRSSSESGIAARHRITANDEIRSPWSFCGCETEPDLSVCRHFSMQSRGGRLTRPAVRCMARTNRTRVAHGRPLP